MLDPFVASQSPGSGSTQEALREGALAAAARPDVILLQYGPIRFPLSCPQCGAAAQRTLPVNRAARVLVYHDDNPNETFHEIDTLQVPFCERCIDEHFRTQHPHNGGFPWKRLLGGDGTGEALGALIVAGVAFFFLKEAILKLSFILLAFAMLPASVAFWLLRKNWRQNEFMTVVPPSPITSAVEFTPNLAAAYEPAWRAFRFRHTSYAAQFREANAEMVWNPQGATAKEARAKRRASTSRNNRIIMTVVVIVLVWGLWSEYGPDIADLIDRLR